MTIHLNFKFLKYYLTNLLFIIATLTATPVKAEDDFATFDWMTAPLSALASLFNKCLEVPETVGFNVASQNLNLADQSQWISTGSKVKSGKLLKFDWSTKGIEALSRKYLVLYRIDPRFPAPQIFIQTYDYVQRKYVSDFHQYKTGRLIDYQIKPFNTWNQRIADYKDYFNFTGRAHIPIYNGDIINITLAKTQDFFTSNGEFSSELDSEASQTSIIYTKSPANDNQIIYVSAPVWCNALSSVDTFSSMVCQGNTYKNSQDTDSARVGKPNEYKFTTLLPKLNSCPQSANTKNLSNLCFYDKGRGMRFLVNGQPIKEVTESFIHSTYLGKDIFYYKSSASGNLEITTDWDIAGMFTNYNQFMSDWALYPDYNTFILTMTLLSTNGNNVIDLSMKYLHFGRYIMKVEVGNGDRTISFEEQSAIKVEYIISDTKPANGTTGTEISKNFRTDAPSDGYLWLRVINPNSQIQGIITVNYANYTGSTVFSDIVYNKAIIPLKDKFSELTEIIYRKLASDPTLQRIAKLMLTLYIIIYGLFFLSGATKITVEDIVTRVIKIAIIVALFSEESWTFFNNNLFDFFVKGTDYIMTRVVDATSSTANVFGFIDPVIEKYTNGRVWGLLFIQLLQIHNGLTFLAIMTIYAMLLFFRSVLEVIIGYCLAFVGLAVMISLAPFFITLMLFEQTKSIFDNWLSTLFDYTIQPTILLIFFLLIDQMIGAQLLGSVTKACWGCLIPLQISLDLRHIGIPIDFSFPLPFLPCIPFYVTGVDDPTDISNLIAYHPSFLSIVTSVLLFYAYCLMANGLVDYITIVTSQLTNVTPARREGKFQSRDNAVAGVMSDIKSITVDPIKSVASTIKSKTLDQNYEAQPSTRSKPKDFSGEISKGSRFDMDEKPKTNTSDKDKRGKNV